VVMTAARASAAGIVAAARSPCNTLQVGR
jgi:hypothetical protein